MADISDPIVWSTIVQTIVLSLTLIIFTLSFRSQNKSIQEQAYQKVMDDYGDAMRMLSERPELYAFQLELFNTSGRPFGQEQKSYSREEMVIRNYVIMLYGFFERIYFLYRRKWIDEDTWKQWAAFLEVIAAHPRFQGRSSVVSRNVRQVVPRLHLWNPQPQEMKQTISLRESRSTLSAGSSFCGILHEFIIAPGWEARTFCV